MAVTPDPAPLPDPIYVPEPAPVAEAGVTTSEWKVLVGYVVQLAAGATGALVGKATGAQVDPQVLQIAAGLEVGLTVAAVSWIIGRAIRKVGTSA